MLSAMMWRRIRQSPGFTAVAAITLGLGIGANTAVFSVIDPLLLRQVPVRDPERLVLLHSAGTLETVQISEWNAFEEYSADRESLEGVLASGTPRDGAVSVSANYFDVLGVQPHAGRFFAAGDASAAGPASHAAVLSHAYWMREFGGDPSAVGRTVTVRGQPRTIAGIAPRGFSGLSVGAAPDVYLPIERRTDWVMVVARLRPGVSLDRARVALEPRFRRIVSTSEVPEVERPQVMARLVVTPAGRGLSESRDRLGARPWALMAVVAAVLAIACANVAGLFLTRAASRRQELALELALGATRGHLLRRSLMDAAGVAALGTIAGLVVAHWVSRALVAWLAVGPAPIALAADLNLRVLTFTGVLLGVTMLVCGALPALAITRLDVTQGLRSRGAGLDRGARASGLRRALVVAQIAVSVTLLGGTGLLVRSLVNLHTADLGFDASHVLAVSLRDRRTGRPAGQADAVLADIVGRTRALPGVEGVAIAALPPLSGSEIGINVIPESRPSAAPIHTFMAPGVSPAYFETLGVRLVSGASCPGTDATAVVINERLARHLFGATPPIGERVRFVEGRRPPMTVVGVAADTTYHNVREAPRNIVYTCRAASQSPSAGAVVFVRTATAPPEALAIAVREIAASADASLEVARAQTLKTYLVDSLHPDRLVAGLFSAFTLIAVIISAVGLYGVLASTVTRQTAEIGLRMALGADAWHVVRFVAGPAARLTAAGLILGTAGAAVATSLLASLLFGLGGWDPLTWAGVAGTLAVISILASLVPLARAVRIDPVTALRAD